MTAPLLEARSLVKTYGHVQALRGANFAAYPGEVVAVVGDNGAGTSTLVTCLSGTSHPDAGEIWFEGRLVVVESPAAARRLGIETVYQDLALAPDLDSAANLFLGRETLAPGLLGRLGVLDRRRMRREAATAFRELGIDLPDVSTHNVEAILRGSAGYVRRAPGGTRTTTLAGNYVGDSKIEEMGAKSMPLAAACAHLTERPGDRHLA